jgi:hypothetical protein
MRWYVPIMPLLLFYFGLWIDRVRITRLLWTLVILAFGVSCFHVQDALSSPFQYSVWHNWLENTPNRGRVGKTFNLPKRRGKGAKESRGRRGAEKPAAGKSGAGGSGGAGPGTAGASGATPTSAPSEP